VTAPVGLARVTVAAPQRRIDVALPEGVPVAELMPHLLRHAGENAADEGERHGGWALRTASGTVLEPLHSLASQGVRDGEILHLVPRRMEWPELAYDDVVEVIASGARRTGRSWGAAATRRCTLAVTAAVLVAGVAVPALDRSRTAGLSALAFAVVLTLGAVLLSRAFGDAVAGAVVGSAGLLYAAAGGALLGTDDRLLPGAGALLLFSVVGYVAVAAGSRMFVAGTVVGLLGLLAALLRDWSVRDTGAAAVVLTVAVGLLPGYPLLATWLGRLPTPALPQRPEELLDAVPAPPRSTVFDAVARSTELLTGFLLGASVVGVVGIGYLAARGGGAGYALALCASGALLLRARLFPGVRQRVPLIVAGTAGVAVLVGGLSVGLGARVPVPVRIGVVGVLALAVLAGGLGYSRRPPSPRLGRLADIVDALAILALVPLSCLIAGLYDAIRALTASVG